MAKVKTESISTITSLRNVKAEHRYFLPVHNGFVSVTETPQRGRQSAVSGGRKETALTTSNTAASRTTMFRSNVKL
jgi:hypothetical protein